MKTQSIMISLLLMAVFMLGACSKDTEEPNTTKQQNTNVIEDRVITIQDKTFTKDDLEFYTLMKKIQIETKRYKDIQNLEGEELSSQNVYWDEQLTYYDNMNVQLQHLVELYAMSLLAEEKHYDVPREKLEKEVEQFRAQVLDIPKANEIIVDYGEAKFNRNIYDYMRQSLLRDRIVADLEKELKAEQPEIREKELNYQLSKQYEDLYVDQIGDLVIEVHVK